MRLLNTFCSLTIPYMYITHCDPSTFSYLELSIMGWYDPHWICNWICFLLPKNHLVTLSSKVRSSETIGQSALCGSSANRCSCYEFQDCHGRVVVSRWHFSTFCNFWFLHCLCSLFLNFSSILRDSINMLHKPETSPILVVSASCASHGLLYSTSIHSS